MVWAKRVQLGLSLLLVVIFSEIIGFSPENFLGWGCGADIALSPLFGYSEKHQEGQSGEYHDVKDWHMQAQIEHERVTKKVLENGLTVLVWPTHRVPKVSMTMMYNVGSKDEQSGERGLAHLLEHMIFKGTEELSESDITFIAHKLSAYCNAFTSPDYTGYVFEFPTWHWKQGLRLFADCMRNCTFKKDMLDSEFKAVIQELKLYRDDYVSSLVEQMVSAMFHDHPYHHSVIGYKQDLWEVTRENLLKFYHKHYVPNNATLVIVGDVEPDEVFAAAQEHFGLIKADPTHAKQEFYHARDLMGTGVTLYRDVQQPFAILAFEVPGARQKIAYPLDVIAWVLGNGKGSRLYKKLVDELQLVTSVEVFNYDMFDHSPFFIYVQPKEIKDLERIIEVINEQIQGLANGGMSARELMRAQKKTQSDYLALLENSQRQGYELGKFYLATGDEQYVINYLDYPVANLATDVQDLLRGWFRPSLMHRGMVLSLADADREVWQTVQEQSDKADQRIMEGRVRETTVEPPVAALKVTAQEPERFPFAKPEVLSLSNGLKVLAHHNSHVPKIQIALDLKAESYYDPDDQQGLNSFMSAMLSEGTEKYTAAELADEIETRGMSFCASPGGVTMSMLSEDFEFGLELLHEILTQATFDEAAITKVRTHLLANLKEFWDTPHQFIGQLVCESLFKNHPYGKRSMGDEASIKKITRDDLIDFYQKYVSPQDARLAIVGDLSKWNVREELEKTLGAWQGPVVEDIEFPKPAAPKPGQVTYPINRDQIVLAFASLSVSRLDKGFDALMIFDQILSGGMSSRLFMLREQTGLFYTIRGSLVAGADEQPGIVLVTTIVSRENLAEAEQLIKQELATVADTITEDDVREARHAIFSALIDNFASNRGTASAFLVQDRFNLPADYFDGRSEKLAKITVDDVKQAVKRVLKADDLVTFKVGRTDGLEEA